MSAMVVGEWARSYSVQQHVLGDILQTRDLGAAEWIVPRAKQPAVRTKGSLWGTGRPWTEWSYGQGATDLDDDGKKTRRIRAALRRSNGVSTTWANDGLHIRCEGVAWRHLMTKRNERRSELGECRTDGIMATLLTDLAIGMRLANPQSGLTTGSCIHKLAG
jgi:hypothetical protein